MELLNIRKILNKISNLDEDKKRFLNTHLDRINNMQYYKDEYRFRRTMKKRFKGMDIVSLYDRDDFEYLDNYFKIL